MAEKKIKLLKLTIGEWNNASRDKRELSVCRELGMDILVIAKGAAEDRDRREIVDGFDVIRLTTRPLGSRFPLKLNRLASAFYFALKTRKLRPDIISAHDLGALMIAWLSTLLMFKKPQLVYDSHEFELGRAGVKRSRFQKWMLKKKERFLIKRSSFSIMVNDVIADTVQKMYHLKNRPVVVRNIPNYWTIDTRVCKELRDSIMTKMDTSCEMLIMYHGAVREDRGIEMLLDVLSHNHKICLLILGNGEDAYMNKLKHLIEDQKFSKRILYHPAVHINELWKYIGASDVGMITIPAVSESYYFMLPNKFFENIQCQTPVICSDYPAISPLVKKYEIGLTCDPLDLNSINDCIEKMRIDKSFYQKCKDNAGKAKQELCWENEKIVLLEAYKKLLD